MTRIFWPPPRLLTLMDESVLLLVERVPTWVGPRPMGGGRRVNLGSQRIAPAVVSWFAIAREELEGDIVSRDLRSFPGEEFCCAVVETVGYVFFSVSQIPWGMQWTFYARSLGPFLLLGALVEVVVQEWRGNRLPAVFHKVKAVFETSRV